MSQWDDSQDPWNAPYNGDGAGPAAPAANNGPGSAVYDRVAQLYLNALGRPGSDAEIHQWADGKTVNDLATIQQQIYATPEADAFSRSQQQQAPKATDPPNPVQTPQAPAPAPGPAPGPNAAPTPATPNVAPAYNAPAPFVPPPAFKYQDFAAPTGQDVLNDPGYGFELNQGIQAIGAKNAALGTLNTGGTIKDFMGFGQNLASTKYNDLFNRKLTEYGTNRGNALDTYNTNYGTQYKDPYAINYASQYQDPFANSMASAGMNQNNNQFNASLGQNNNQFNSSLDWQKFLQNYKATVTDPFSQKYSLLQLI